MTGQEKEVKSRARGENNLPPAADSRIKGRRRDLASPGRAGAVAAEQRLHVMQCLFALPGAGVGPSCSPLGSRLRASAAGPGDARQPHSGSSHRPAGHRYLTSRSLPARLTPAFRRASAPATSDAGRIVTQPAQLSPHRLAASPKIAIRGRRLGCARCLGSARAPGAGRKPRFNQGDGALGSRNAAFFAGSASRPAGRRPRYLGPRSLAKRPAEGRIVFPPAYTVRRPSRSASGNLPRNGEQQVVVSVGSGPHSVPARPFSIRRADPVA